MQQIGAQLAESLSHSSYILYTTKREKDAIFRYEEEVRILRELHAYDHSTYQADLSCALNNVGVALYSAERFQ